MIAQKIHQMSSYLQTIGLSASEIDLHVSSASEEIHSGLIELVTYAVREAEAAGNEMTADEFLKEIDLNEESGYVQIGTSSGKLDFSEPPYPMLPWLLKNPKVAKDGSLYKVIPVGASSGEPKTNVIKNIDAAVARISGSSKASDMASSVAANFGMGGTIYKETERTRKPAEGFRVASSKQDPNSSWVKPPSKKDMTAVVMDINSRLRVSIDNLTDSVIAKHISIAESAVKEY